MRVFLDTNVVASAFATKGRCADLLRQVLSAHQLVVSPPLFSELERVLLAKFKVERATADAAIAFLQHGTILAIAECLPDIEFDDSDDIIMLASALAGGAEVFVTGDKAVQTLRQIGNMRILSPRAFCDEFLGSGTGVGNQ